MKTEISFRVGLSLRLPAIPGVHGILFNRKVAQGERNGSQMEERDLSCK